MKKLLLILLCLPMIGFGQQTYVPDNNFEQALINLGYDNVLDDSVLTANINTVTILNIESLNISNLEGIEAFISLTTLDCSDNLFTRFPSNNLNINWSSQSLTSLDLSNNPNLEYIIAENTTINTLNVNGCNNLWSIWFDNSQLTSLDLSTNTALSQIYLQNNQIQDTLDFSNCPVFWILEARNNNLSFVNLKNGNPFSEVWLAGNPNLTCILVDSNEVINTFQLDPQQYFSTNCSGTSIQEHTTNKELLKETDLLGRETKGTKNEVLFYIYDDGTVEKRIVIE